MIISKSTLFHEDLKPSKSEIFMNFKLTLRKLKLIIEKIWSHLYSSTASYVQETTVFYCLYFLYQWAKTYKYIRE